jgi:uncharacterized membrane protein YfcA
VLEVIKPSLIGLTAGLLVGLAKTGLPGISILAIALLMEILPARMAVGALLPLLILGDLFAIGYYRRNADWARLWALFPCVILGVIGGFFFLRSVSDVQLKFILGALVLGLTLLELGRQRFGWNNYPRRPWFTVGMGTLAGFATTVGNVAGPIMNIYMLSRGFDKLRFMGTAAWYFFIFNCVKVPLYCSLGMINRDVLLLDLVCAPATIVGALLGRKILKRLSPVFFRRMVLALAALAALRLMTS